MTTAATSNESLMFIYILEGAGKTTTFSMLTGDLGITEGTAFLDGYNLNTNLRQVCKHRLQLPFLSYTGIQGTRVTVCTNASCFFVFVFFFCELFFASQVQQRIGYCPQVSSFFHFILPSFLPLTGYFSVFPNSTRPLFVDSQLVCLLLVETLC